MWSGLCAVGAVLETFPRSPWLIPAGLVVVGGFDYAVQYFALTRRGVRKDIEDVPSPVHDSPPGAKQVVGRSCHANYVSTVFVRRTYIAAGAAGWLAAAAADASGAILSGLAATLSSTIVVFAGSLASGNSSVFDPYWCLLPQGLSIWWMTKDPSSMLHPAKLVPCCLVWLWAARFHSLVPWDGWQKQGLAHEDWRYSGFRGKIRNDAAYWAFSFSSFHLTPALLVFGASIPLARLLAAPSASLPAPSIAQAGAWAFSLAAIGLEAVADEQLRSFRASRAYRKGLGCMTEGLWRYSRHPNYFGEVAWWIGVWLMGTCAGTSTARIDAAGALAMLAFFRFASVPIMDERSIEQRGSAYARIMASTSPLVPFPPIIWSASA